jgi:hypothetical protein
MLKFNRVACEAALKAELMATIDRLVTEMYMNMVADLRPNAKMDLVREQVKIQAGIISGRVVAGAYAIMDSYGTGSLMDMTNPFLNEYIQTANWGIPMFNPLRLRRRNFAILGREKGVYRVITGDPPRRRSKGRMAGLNLEELSSMVTKTGKVKFSTRAVPIYPSKALQTAFRWIVYTRINKEVMKTVQNFNFARFFEFTLDRR